LENGKKVTVSEDEEKELRKQARELAYPGGKLTEDQLFELLKKEKLKEKIGKAKEEEEKGAPGGGGPMVSFAAGAGVKNLGLGVAFSAGDLGYYLSVSGGQITGLSAVAGWNFSEPSAGLTTEATIAGGRIFGGSYSVVNDISGNSISFSSNIAAGLGIGFSKGLTTTITFNLYPMPAPAANQKIMNNPAVAPDRTRTQR
jgi:hypothetical protein